MTKTGAADWEDLRVLLAIGRESSFLAAGRTLGLSTSTVARRISALEEQLGVALVRRTASGATLDPNAKVLLELAEDIESRLALAARDLSASAESLAGVVRVSLGEGFMRVGARIGAAFRREHPETLIELVADTRMVDLPKREADIGIRTAPSTSDAVTSRRIADLRYGLYASEEYLQGTDTGRLARFDFSNDDFVIYQGFLEQQPEIRWLRDRGAKRFPFRASTTDGLLEGTLAGQGIAALPVVLADGTGLQRLRLEEDPPPKTIFIAMHSDMRAVPRVRAVADAFIEGLARGLGTRR